MLNCILRLAQQHSFIVEECGCLGDLLALQMLHQRRPRNVEQLQSCIRQQWSNIAKVQKLVSMVTGRFWAVVWRRGNATPWRTWLCPKVLLSWNSNQLKSFPKWYIFSFSIWYVYYVLLWIKCGCMRFANCCILGVFILILTQSPNFFLTGFVEEAGWPKEREEWRGMKRGINCAETEMEIKTED